MKILAGILSLITAIILAINCGVTINQVNQTKSKLYGEMNDGPAFYSDIAEINTENALSEFEGFGAAGFLVAGLGFFGSIQKKAKTEQKSDETANSLKIT